MTAIEIQKQIEISEKAIEICKLKIEELRKSSNSFLALLFGNNEVLILEYECIILRYEIVIERYKRLL